MISGTVVRSVNIALQTFGIMVALAMMSSFRRDLLRNRSQRLLFSKIVTATVCMVCFVIYNLRGTGRGDPFDMILISLSQVGLYVVSYLYIEYLRAQIEEIDAGRRVPASVQIAALVICVAGSTLRVVSTASGGFGKYGGPDSGSGITFEIGHAGGVILMGITIIILCIYYRTLGVRHTIILASMPVLMLLAVFLEPHAGGIDLYYPFIIIEFCIVYTQHHLDIARQTERDRMDETKARLALATGRMKPHYLYNVLTTIYYLCETDPQKAQRAIGTFSEYLRSTLETMEKQELVNFSWELAEIRHYLELEKLRFGRRLTVEYDIEAEDFLVPPLSIQPLVENAVKHGIAPKEEGGTVRILSRWLSDGGAQIRVIDDGVGFDVSELRNMDVTHEGLANVRERLRLEVGGELTITSSPGKTTTAIVTIRPQKAENMHR